MLSEQRSDFTIKPEDTSELICSTGNAILNVTRKDPNKNEQSGKTDPGTNHT